MSENLEINQETIDALLNNPSFLEAVAKKMGTSQPAKVGGFVDAGSVSGGAFPQMSKEQLRNFAKSINASVDQAAALAQYETLTAK